MILAKMIIILSIFFLLAWAFIAFAIYFIPLIIAYIRRHNNLCAIALLNIILGWTFLGWLAALLWSLNSDIEENNSEV